MTPDEIENTVVALLVQYADVVTYLRNEMGLPQFVLRNPQSVVHLLIDGNVRRSLYVNNDAITPIEYNQDVVGWDPTVSAGFSFNDQTQALVFNSRILAADANAAGMTEAALLEILTLHEFVHIAMMGWWFRECPWHNWVMDYQQRYRSVHETVALFFCEFGLPGIDNATDPDDIHRYLGFVQELVNEERGKRFYGPYYQEYQNLQPTQIWPAIMVHLGDNFIEDLAHV